MSEGVTRRAADDAESVAANRVWWDEESRGYYADHGAFLGDRDLVWGPEGWHEHELHCLGDLPLAGLTVLEFGGGAAQGGRWLTDQGALVVSTDLSLGMLRTAAAIDEGSPGRPRPALVQCPAQRLPFADESFDLAFSAYGATPFVADSAGLLREIARVLRPGGRVAFSTSHPVRWAFPDVPGPEGLTAHGSYFDRTPYVETDANGRATYVEHHRTVGDRVGEVIAAGLTLVSLVEPEWPSRNTQSWGGWSPLRGEHLPGTLIVVADKPPRQDQ